MKDRCSYCDGYEKDGHNYCRMCGFHVRKGFVDNARIAVAFNTQEKFCGFCGGERNDCECCAK